jgi:hypothetical protein
MHNLDYQFGDFDGKILSVGDTVRVVNFFYGEKYLGVITKLEDITSIVEFDVSTTKLASVVLTNRNLVRWEVEDRI